MKSNTYISGYYPMMDDRFMVVLGGDEKMVEAFNRGEFGAYKGTVKGFEEGSFKLEHEAVEMY